MRATFIARVFAISIAALTGSEAANRPVGSVQSELMQYLNSDSRQIGIALRKIFWVLRNEYEGRPMKEILRQMEKSRLISTRWNEPSLEVTLLKNVKFQDVKRPCNIDLELIGNARGLAMIFRLSANLIQPEGKLTKRSDPVFLDRCVFTSLLRTRGFLQQAGDYTTVTGAGVSYCNIASSREPFAYYGFELDFELRKAPAAATRLGLVYRAASGLDPFINTVTGERRPGSGQVIQRWPREADGIYGDTVKGQKSPAPFKFVSRFTNTRVQ